MSGNKHKCHCYYIFQIKCFFRDGGKFPSRTECGDTSLSCSNHIHSCYIIPRNIFHQPCTACDFHVTTRDDKFQSRSRIFEFLLKKRILTLNSSVQNMAAMLYQLKKTSKRPFQRTHGLSTSNSSRVLLSLKTKIGYSSVPLLTVSLSWTRRNETRRLIL